MFVLQKMDAFNDAGLSSFALGAPGGAVTLGALTFESLPLDQRIAQFDLTLMMAEANEELRGCFEYSTDLFEHETIERMAGHFGRLLENIVDSPELPITDYSLLTPAEHKQLRVEWNSTETKWRRETCLHEMFERQVEATPGAVALVCGSEELTYMELNERANQLGRHLRELGVRAETRVGICLERRVELVVGLLAVLKAGGAYVPVDPKYPRPRQEMMLRDAGAAVVLTSAGLRESLPGQGGAVVCVDSEQGEIRKQSRGEFEQRGSRENLAYVIYTSGSTGTPKGVG